MSAFFVGHAHVNALLSFYKRHCDRHANADELGKVLLAENVRSLLARYPNHDHSEERDDVTEYRFKLAGAQLTPEDIISMCDCFDYQACETDDYHVTEASDIVERIRRAAYGELTWPRDGMWHYTGDN